MRDVAERVARVVEEHHAFVWRLLRRYGVAEAHADDAAQDVMCVFARRAAEVEVGKEKAFLFGTALRVARDRRRWRARHPESDDDALEHVVSDARTPDELVDARRARAMLDRVLGEMEEPLRAVFVLHELEEMTMSEVADVLGIAPGTVASRLRKARSVFEGLAQRARGGAR